MPLPQKHAKHILEPHAASSLPNVESQGFTYDRLPSEGRCLRLLTLYPGQWEDTIRCSLSTVGLDPLDESAPYEAISYVWGDPTKCREIICGNQNLSITNSLFDALQILRPLVGEGPRTLWADGICINQSDTEEKSQQVQIMGSIYSNAIRVLVWLGHDSPEKVEAGLDLVCQIASRGWDEARQGRPNQLERALAPQNWHNSTYKLRADTNSSPRTRHASRELPEFADVDALYPLFTCRWFTRLWILQEIVLSKAAVVVWGLGSISFDLLELAAIYVSSFHTAVFIDTREAIRGVMHCIVMRGIRPAPWEDDLLLEILELTRDYEVSDPRDKVYGMLGLRMKNPVLRASHFLKPDYSLSVVEVYTTVAEKLCFEKQDTDVLAMVQHGPCLAQDWPSWVPDWSHPRTSIFMSRSRNTSLGTLATIERPSCTTCGKISHNGPVVSIKGIVVGGIRRSTENLNGNSFGGSNSESFRYIQKLCLEFQGDYNEETIAFTMSAGRGPDGHLAEPTQSRQIASHIASFQNFLAWNVDQYFMTGTDIPPPPQKYNAEVQSAYRFYMNISANVIERRFFITTGGDLGLGPLAMQEGDLVVVLFGGTVPFVLRPLGDGQHFRLVGEAYVHAIMGGQAVENWRKSGEPATEFHLY